MRRGGLRAICIRISARWLRGEKVMSQETKTNKKVTFNDLIEYFNGRQVYIPLIQRNYRWDSKTARKLVEDICDAFSNGRRSYTIGMVTLYRKADGCAEQLIDGQQRVITLYLILKALSPESKVNFKFSFERDEGDNPPAPHPTRREFLENITEEAEAAYPDLERFLTNYREICRSLERVSPEKRAEIAQYMHENVILLLRCTGMEPFDEFINQNKNKTRFVISDRVRANLLIVREAEERDKVLNLFQALSALLFSESDLWKLVSTNYICEEAPPVSAAERNPYKLYADENRLKILCCEREDHDLEKEFNLLQKYREILGQLLKDIKCEDWCSHNAITCLQALNSPTDYRFFKMLNDGEQKEPAHLEDYLLHEFNEMGESQMHCFIESQMCDKPRTAKSYPHLEESPPDPSMEITSCAHSAKTQFEEIYKEYIQNKYAIGAV